MKTNIHYKKRLSSLNAGGYSLLSKRSCSLPNKPFYWFGEIVKSDFVCFGTCCGGLEHILTTLWFPRSTLGIRQNIKYDLYCAFPIPA